MTTPFHRTDSGSHYSASLPPPEVLDAARCAEADPEEWFPEKGQPGDRAKRICGMCPAQTACLEWALETRQRHGIWGGLSANERRTIHEKRAAAAKDGDAA